MNRLGYPLEMRHPHYRPAIISGYRRNPDGSSSNDPPGRPAMNPPVWVNNRDQELRYASLGYLPVGVGDAQAYLREVLDADLPSTYRHQEYPKWLYRFNGTLESALVKNEEEHARMSGWSATPDEAKNQFEAEKTPVEDEPPEIDRVASDGMVHRHYKRRRDKVA